jgi:pyruvate dehydrogenase E2 component (dihydrolipoyllysine-residue acetyltransferase)
MADMKLPELGENVTSGDVLRVLVSPGETVAKDQPVLELETDKATIEVPSSVAGVIQDVKVKPGDKVTTGQMILTVGDGALAREPRAAEPAEPSNNPADTAQQAKADAPKTAEPQTLKSPPAAADAKAQKSVQLQPQAEAPEPASESELEEQGANASAPAPGQTEEQEADDSRTERRAAEPAAVAPEPRRRGEVVNISRSTSAPAEQALQEDGGPSAAAAPSVRRLARELGVSIDHVIGSGPRGRIGQDDVKAHARQIVLKAGAVRGAERTPLPDFSRWGEIERKPMSGIRRKTAEHLSLAWSTIPHVTQHDRADMSQLELFRKKYEKQIEDAGGVLTVTAILLKVVSAALKMFPQFTTSVDMAAQEIIYRKYVHVGVAVDTDRGLLVPVIREADTKNIQELSTELKQLAEKARAHKLALEEMQGGTFTITNLGGFGGTYFSPIINWPEVAILGVSRASTQPVFVDNGFEPRLLLPLSLSYDHRVIDGADAIRFLRWIVEALEQPMLMSLRG